MVKQYPYSLYTGSAGGTKNNNGDYVGATQTFTGVSVCRDEVNSGGSTVTLADSTEQVYDSLIVAPLSCPVLPTGTSIEVRDGTTLRVKGTVKRFHKGQLHCRVWV